jgi:hypothetical protein
MIDFSRIDRIESTDKKKKNRIKVLVRRGCVPGAYIESKLNGNNTVSYHES